MSAERAGAVAAGSQPAIELVANPGHPSNRVDVQYRVDGGPVRVAHAAPVEPAAPPSSQPFLARLPALASGQVLEYRAELRRAGRLIDTTPADGTWMTMTAEAQAPRTDPLPPPASAAAGIPRFGYEPEFLGALTVRLRPEVIGQTPDGYRINFFVEQGKIRGPKLNGLVRPEGGDWMTVRPDGVGLVHIRVTYEMDDGGLVLEESGGVIYVGPDGYEQVVRGVFKGTPHVYLTPKYITSDPRLAWINSFQCFGIGHVVMEELRLECDIYAPHVTTDPSGD
jgi:Protein of unknown function (DUF3237)